MWLRALHRSPPTTPLSRHMLNRIDRCISRFGKGGTRFTRTRLSAIVRPVSSLQLTEDPDRVRSFGGYNTRKLIT